MVSLGNFEIPTYRLSTECSASELKEQVWARADGFEPSKMPGSKPGALVHLAKPQLVNKTRCARGFAREVPAPEIAKAKSRNSDSGVTAA